MVSVIVTFHNNEEFVSQCLNSIIAQTYKDFEIIIIDDGSEDKTALYANEYVEKYSNISYHYIDHCGVSVARNHGIKVSKGEFIMFVDGDDYLKNNILEELYDSLDDTVDIICCGYTAFNDINNLADEGHFFPDNRDFSSKTEKEDLYLQLLNDHYGTTDEKIYTAIGVPWGKLYRKDFLMKNELLFSPKFIRMQDNIFNMYAFNKAGKIRYCNKPLYMYRVNHIQSYKAAYKPEIYMLIVKERAYFFEKIYTDATEKLMNELKKSIVQCCLISIKNIVMTNKRKTAKIKIKELCKEPIYKEHLEVLNLNNFSKKDKYGIILIRKKMFGILISILRLKSKIKN